MMPSTSVTPAIVGDDRYSIWMGLVYVFNLMVGTGALALPAALEEAGWALGGAMLLLLAGISYAAAALLLETLAAVNTLRSRRALCAEPHLQPILKSSDDEEEDEDEERSGEHMAAEETRLTSTADGNSVGELSPPASPLDQRVELGEMAQVLLSAPGRVLFYVTLCLYLYGDLSIYSAAVANSLQDVICTYRPYGWSNATRLPDWEPCWNDTAVPVGVVGSAGAWPATRGGLYRMALLAFTAALAPFTYFNMQKTKYLQLITTAMRWLALGAMVSLATARLAAGEGEGQPAAARVGGVPSLFGTCVYSFMWHHSVPGLVAPVRDKRSLMPLLAVAYTLVAAFYLLLSLTGVFAFAHLDPLYTLNFVPPPGEESAALRALQYFLALFPVLTLSASYPVVAVTLRNNLRTMVGTCADGACARALLPLATVAPPLLLTLLVEDVGVLIHVTGSIAGVGVQYVMPALLVSAARRRRRGGATAGAGAAPLLLQAWAVLCVTLVSVHFAQTLR